jgi:hypothetical protein
MRAAILIILICLGVCLYLQKSLQQTAERELQTVMFESDPLMAGFHGSDAGTDADAPTASTD